MIVSAILILEYAPSIYLLLVSFNHASNHVYDSCTIQYTFSEETRRAFSGFLVTISDQSNHSVKTFQEDSKVRSNYFNSTVLRETNGFVGDIWNVAVEVMALEEGNNFVYDSMQLSGISTCMLVITIIVLDQCMYPCINSLHGLEASLSSSKVYCVVNNITTDIAGYFRQLLKLNLRIEVRMTTAFQYRELFQTDFRGTKFSRFESILENLENLVPQK